MPKDLTLKAKLTSPGTINNGDLKIRGVLHPIDSNPWEQTYFIRIADDQKSVRVFLSLNAFSGTQFTLTLTKQGAANPFFTWSEQMSGNLFEDDKLATLP